MLLEAVTGAVAVAEEHAAEAVTAAATVAEEKVNESATEAKEKVKATRREVHATKAEEKVNASATEATKAAEKAAPGFEGVFAIAGLLAVASLVLNRRE